MLTAAEVPPSTRASASARRMRTVAAAPCPLTGGLPSVRQDVDSPADLAAAVGLGVGSWTGSSALGLG